MFNKAFDEIDKAYIESLIEDEVVEAKHLDYKETLPGDTDREKNRFVEDVCSFANAAGGDIFFGLAERKDTAAQKTGTPVYVGLKGVNFDQEKLRLEHIILNKIEPRISGIQFRLVEDFADGPILIMRIPRSYNAPHMTKHDGRFRSRTDSGNYAMDVQEVRSAFIASETLPERIRQFRADRLSKIVACETPVIMNEGGKHVLHLLPLSAFQGKSGCAILEIEAELRSRLGQINGHVDAWRYNLDGVLGLGSQAGSRGAMSYTQFFKSGIIESVDTSLLTTRPGVKVIPSVAYERDLLARLRAYTSSMDGLGIEPPVLVMVTLIQVLGYELAVAARFQSLEPSSIDRDTVITSEVTLEDSRQDIGRLMRPVFDDIWNACGYARSMSYDEEGNWKPPY